MYHGSRALFDAYDVSYCRTPPGAGSSRLGVGMYWTNNRDKAAQAYASMSDRLSDSSFRGTPLNTTVIYKTVLDKTEQQKILDLHAITNDILACLTHLSSSPVEQNSLRDLSQSKDRYVDFSIWARAHQELLKKAGFNCLKDKNVFCFIEPEKLKWTIDKAHVVSGTKIPRSLLTADSQILIQNHLFSSTVASGKIQNIQTTGQNLLANNNETAISVLFPEKNMLSKLKNMIRQVIRSPEKKIQTQPDFHSPDR